MQLTDQEIAELASWGQINPDYGRDNTQTERRVNQIVTQLNATADYACQLLQGDGLSNYFVLFAYQRAAVPKNPTADFVPGLLLYINAGAPIFVAGHSRKVVGPGFYSFAPLELSQLLTTDHATDKFEADIFHLLSSHGYQLLTAEDASRQLPAGVEIYEYCFCNQPWDRVFHALFANTD